MTKRNVGWVLVIIGLFMLFKMVRVSSFGFYRIGRVSTSAIVLILLILSAIAVVIGTGLIIKSALERHNKKDNKYEY